MATKKPLSFQSVAVEVTKEEAPPGLAGWGVFPVWWGSLAAGDLPPIGVDRLQKLVRALGLARSAHPVAGFGVAGGSDQGDVPVAESGYWPSGIRGHANFRAAYRPLKAPELRRCCSPPYRYLLLPDSSNSGGGCVWSDAPLTFTLLQQFIFITENLEYMIDATRNPADRRAPMTTNADVRAKFKRSAACLFASTALLLSGCAISPAQSSTESPAAAAATTHSAKAADSTPSAPAVDYGPVLGTFTIHATNSDGYTATIKAVLHKPTLVSSTKDMPSWCPDRFSNGSSADETLSQASSIISQTVEASYTLDNRPGFPDPSKWAPNVSTHVSSVGDHDPYPGYGKCSANSAGGPAPTLTSEGYKTVTSDIKYGRSTPAKPLPTKIEDVHFDENGYYFTVKDGNKCQIQAADGFTFGAETNPDFNSPERNDGHCTFFVVPKAG